MALIDIQLPRMGEGVIEATITKWMVKVGDRVEEDDSLVEVATDKVDSEVPAPEEGIVKEIRLEEGSVPKVGEILLVLETEGEGPEPDRQEVLDEVERITTEPAAPAEESKVTPLAVPEVRKTSAGKFLSPLVRKIAAEESVSQAELDQLQGSGKDGRITKKDILGYLEQRKSPVPKPEPEPVPAPSKPEPAPTPRKPAWQP